MSRAKRDAVAAVREGLDGPAGPLARRFLDAARRTVESGDGVLERSDDDSRAEALGRYLLSAGLATNASRTADEAAR